MKRLGLTLAAVFCLAAMTFAAGNQPATAKWEGNINVNKLGKYLKLSSAQSEEVANICDYFSLQMSRATTAKKNKEAKLRNAVYGNLKLMKKNPQCGTICQICRFDEYYPSKQRYRTE